MSSCYAFAREEVFQHEDTLRQEETLPQQPFCPTNSCKVIPINAKDIQALQEDSTQKVEELQKNKEFQDFQREGLQKKNPILEDKEFQQFVTELNEKALTSLPTCQNTEKMAAINSRGRSPEENLYIFASFSLGEKALMNLAHEAKEYGATLVLRGFQERSYTKTIQALQKIILKTRQGVSIDPELFTFFSISSVPTYILAKPFQLNSLESALSPLHDRMQGYVSVNYVLETFAKEGDLQSEAKALLTNASLSDRLQRKGRDK